MSRSVSRRVGFGGVALLPGCEFGRPTAELTACMAYVNFDGGRALEAASEVPLEAALSENFLREYCDHALTAVERVSEWVNTATR
jgi:aspartate aminotransferase